VILEHIVEQHAANAAFLWHLRDQATGRPHYKLANLERLDLRVEAHVDGLRIAGDAGWEICAAALADGEAGELFAAALLAVERHDLEGIARVLDASGGDPALSRGIVSALGWAPVEDVQSILPGLLDPGCPPALHCLGIAACAVNRLDPAQALDRAVRSEDSRLRNRAIEAAGELGRTDLLPVVKRHLDAEDDETRFRAGWSATLLGSAQAAAALWEIVEAAGPRAEAALAMAVRRTDVSTSGARLEALAGRLEGLRAAVIGAGALGDPAHVAWIVRAMANPELGRIAGEAYAMITGVDLEDARLEGRPPEGFAPGPSDDPVTEDVAMDPDEDLPWPDVDAVRAHWQESQAALTPGKRYFLGKPISPEWLRQVLRSGGQRRRAAAAIELALLTPGRPLFEVRAPGFRQPETLGV
jgi:uncharacterized protein (TIGR02270 family)